MQVYGNLHNRLMESSKQKAPVIGMGSTIIMYSDRHAATIVNVLKDGKWVVVQEDHSKRIDQNGMSESQAYAYTANEQAKRRIFTKRKNGSYVEQGDSLNNGTKLLVGHRDSYHDYGY